MGSSHAELRLGAFIAKSVALFVGGKPSPGRVWLPMACQQVRFSVQCPKTLWEHRDRTSMILSIPNFVRSFEVYMNGHGRDLNAPFIHRGGQHLSVSAPPHSCLPGLAKFGRDPVHECCIDASGCASAFSRSDPFFVKFF